VVWSLIRYSAVTFRWLGIVLGTLLPAVRTRRELDIREAIIAPRPPWRNAYAERVIGSIRRECLDHVVVIGERHLREILSKYVDYYNRTRTHLSLTKDTPEHRSIQKPGEGGVVEVPRVNGLHHEYTAAGSVSLSD
jgi:hypothetical protein